MSIDMDLLKKGGKLHVAVYKQVKSEQYELSNLSYGIFFSTNGAPLGQIMGHDV